MKTRRKASSICNTSIKIKFLYLKLAGALPELFSFPGAPASERAVRAPIARNWLKAGIASQLLLFWAIFKGNHRKNLAELTNSCGGDGQKGKRYSARWRPFRLAVLLHAKTTCDCGRRRVHRQHAPAGDRPKGVSEPPLHASTAEIHEWDS